MSTGPRILNLCLFSGKILYACQKLLVHVYCFLDVLICFQHALLKCICHYFRFIIAHKHMESKPSRK